MPLVKPSLESAILAAFKKMSAPVGSMEAAQAQLAKDLATAIDTYIKSAKIVIPPGQAVATAGSPSAQAGATVAPSPDAKIS
jgi:hypothetical protein